MSGHEGARVGTGECRADPGKLSRTARVVRARRSRRDPSHSAGSRRRCDGYIAFLRGYGTPGMTQDVQEAPGQQPGRASGSVTDVGKDAVLLGN
jgi:hypothetical protein